MNPKHKIDDEYNTDPRHIKQWDMTIEWLGQFDIGGDCLDCGDITDLTRMIVTEFGADTMENTKHDLNRYNEDELHCFYKYNHIFTFEVIEHLLNPLNFMYFMHYSLQHDGSVYLSTPYNRPNWMRNKERHFHEFNYNELCYLIDVAGFKIVDEKIINPTPFQIGFRPILRKLGIGGRNILMRLKRI